MIYNFLKSYYVLFFISIVIIVAVFSCKEIDTYQPQNNEDTYIREKVEDYDPDIITDKMSEVDEELALKTIVFDCDNPTVKIGGVIIREDEQFNDFNSKNISIPIYYLRLLKSCKIHCNDKGQNKVYENVQTIQIIIDGKVDKLKLVGKKVLVTGQLFGASTTFHKTPVLISAKSFENL